MKMLQISFNGENADISYEMEVGAWKEAISPDVKKLKDEAKRISDNLKYSKNFKKFSIGFTPIDYYDNCDYYEVPYITCTNDDKKLKVGQSQLDEIPKAWMKTYFLKVEGIKDVRLFNKFLENLGLRLGEKELNEFRKAIKSKQYYSYEF